MLWALFKYFTTWREKLQSSITLPWTSVVFIRYSGVCLLTVVCLNFCSFLDVHLLCYGFIFVLPALVCSVDRAWREHVNELLSARSISTGSESRAVRTFYLFPRLFYVSRLLQYNHYHFPTTTTTATIPKTTTTTTITTTTTTTAFCLFPRLLYVSRLL